ncbi:PREDICTED: methyl-CpG-binding domain protein 3-like 1, partial [Galeopterus variegatus]|uniref:Methyl-CpG-binding domain protein 3-like 1 n=1 Tax=Galeopterus variegatus TaxID=482537 RepID=A0ABM0Q3L9_GALVR
WQQKLEKPQQLCAYRRLQGLQPRNSEGDLLSPLNFANALQVTAPRIPGESLGQAGAGGLHSRPWPTLAQSSDWAERIPGAGLHLSPSFYSQEITYADIQRQLRKVKTARERLAKALRADRLAREAERMRSQERSPEKQMKNRKMHPEEAEWWRPWEVTHHVPS